MSIKDWNASLAYAEAVCTEFNRNGYDVRAKQYAMYDGRKGIALQIFDCWGKYQTEVSTGIHANLEDMKRAIDSCAYRIRIALR